MCSVTSEFSAADTGILWDLDCCPIPVNLTLASIYDNFKLSLGNMGYTGTMSIIAYSRKKLKNKEDFESANIKLLQPETLRAKHAMMVSDVCFWGLNHQLCRTNLMVISKDILDDNDCVAAFLRLKEQENNVLLALPQKPSALLCRVSSSVWLWSSLSTGGSPCYINQNGIPQIGTSRCLACKKQMCSATSAFSAADTGVFWDLDCCPIPVNLTPASIYDNFKLSLGNLGYTGTMSIVAYSSKKLKNIEDFESAKIKLLQLETLRAKHQKIILGVYSWVMKHRCQLTNLMVISEDTSTYGNYALFKEHENNILLVFPQDTSGSQRGVSSSIWLWSSLSTGGNPFYTNPIGIPQLGRCFVCKKPHNHKKRGKKGKGLKKRAITQSDETKPLHKRRGKKGKVLRKRATTQSDETSSQKAWKKRKRTEEEGNYSQ